VATAAVVRSWGLDFGLPHLGARPDEALVAQVAAQCARGWVFPAFLRYPTLFMYVLAVPYACWFLGALAAGRFHSAADFLAALDRDPTCFLLISRGLVVAFGVATVVVAYRLARRLVGERGGLAAALLLSLTYLHVRQSHFGTTDVPAAFFVAWAMLRVVRAANEPTLRNYAWAGVVAGLAAATKYVGVLVAVPMLVAHAATVRRARAPLRAILADRRILCFAAAIVAVFLAASPSVLARPALFLADVHAAADQLAAGHHVAVARGWWHHVSFTLLHGLGWPLLGCSLAGLIVLVALRPGAGAAFAAFPLAYYLLMGSARSVFVRYAVPLAPLLCVAAAAFIVTAADLLAQRLRPAGRAAVTAALAAAAVLPSAITTLRFDRLLARTDSRVVATRWAYDNLPPGAAVGQVNYLGFQILHLNRGRLARGRPPFREYTYSFQAGRFLPDGRAHRGSPRFVVIEESPLFSSRTPPSLRRLLRRHYTLRKSFRAMDPPPPAECFDRQDAFYLPYACFEGVLRPGPNVHIYERRPTR
jgi:hypothetical protein